MKNSNLFASLLFAATLVTTFACVKPAVEEPVVVTPTETAPDVPDGARFSIHFGTSTYMGCMYSFRNCIYIDLFGATASARNGYPVLPVSQPDLTQSTFGRVFPLTDNFTIDPATAAELHIEPQTLPAGFYPIVTGADGTSELILSPAEGRPVAPLVNTNNPQDNLGQFHNLALQHLLSPDNQQKISALGNDRAAIQKYLIDQTLALAAESGYTVTATEEKRIRATNLDRNYNDFDARHQESLLSANDKTVLSDIFAEVNGLPVNTPDQLSQFVKVLTEHENTLTQRYQIDNPKLVLSTLSALKYSRYYWFWRSKAFADGQGGTSTAASIPDWVWADVIGMELGGPIASAAASAFVYYDQR